MSIDYLPGKELSVCVCVHAHMCKHTHTHIIQGVSGLGVRGERRKRKFVSRRAGTEVSGRDESANV